MHSVGKAEFGRSAGRVNHPGIDRAEMAQWRASRGRISLALVLLVIAGSFFTLVATVPAGVRAATLYVGGSGPSNYTTIQLAVDAASPGDTVFVYNGSYSEQVTIAKTISLVGEASNVTIIDGSRLGTVVYVTANWVNISGFTVKNSSSAINSAGIELHWVENCRIIDNDVSSNNQLGIFLNHSNGNTIENNDADDNVGIFGAGIYLSYSNNNTVINNTASGNAYGIYAEYSTNNTIILNNASTNWDYGVFFVYSWNSTITDNSFYDNWGKGIFLRRSEGIIVSNNKMDLNLVGIAIQQSGNCSVFNNTIVNSQDNGLALDSSYHNLVYNNTIVNNAGNGIMGWFSHDNAVFNNSIGLNYWAAIELVSSLRETISGNVMTKGGVYISPWNVDTVENWNSHYIDETNLVNGNPVRYWKDAVGGTVPPSSGQIILGNCTGVTVENQVISGVVAGVELGFSPLNAISSSNVSGNVIGIEIYESGNNSISKLTADRGNYGVVQRSSSDTTITDSVMRWNNYSGVYVYLSPGSVVSNVSVSDSLDAGMSIQSSDRILVTDSTLSGNVLGILVANSRDGLIINNTISNSPVGVSLTNTIQVVVYHNRFLSNGVAAQEGSGTSNRWNDSYPSGGNFWSDYSGSDTMHGPGQNLPGADGMGDTPYPVTGGANQDNYPLMRSYPPGPRAPPTAPLNLQAVAGNAQVTLSWSPPNWDGLSAVTNYSIYRGTSSGIHSYLTTLGNVTTFLDTGLTNGVTYYYVVAAINIEGEGPRSSEASARPATLPGPPQSLVATPADRQVTLVWNPPASNGGSAITNYAIYRGTTPGGEVHLVTVGNILSHIDSGLTNGVTYYYMVAAINGLGQGPNSTEVAATPLAVPSEPGNLQATSGNQQITLVWTMPGSDGGSPITNYTVYRGLVPGGETLLVEIGNVLTYTDTGLNNGQAYYYQVAAKNSIGVGARTPEIAATPGVTPGPPAGLNAASGNRQITLTWSPPVDNGGLPVTAYSVYRGNTSGGETFLVMVGNVLTYTDTGLSNGRTYYYKVSAWNAMGEGLKSNEASAAPSVRPSEPADVAAIAGIQEITVMWLPPIDNGGSAIVGYRVYRGTTPGGETLVASLGNVLTYLDGGLPNGATYYYVVSAVNMIGEGPKSIEKSATTPTMPTAPRSLQASAGDGQIRLSWIAPAFDGGMPVRNYEVYRSTSPGAESFLLEVGNVLSYLDTGLVNGQTYYYEVSAKNDVGEGQISAEASASPISPATVPSAPQGLQASAGNRHVTLTWQAPSSDGGSAIIGYRIFSGTSPSGETLVAQLGIELSYTDTGLTNGVTYYYKVAAVNGVGEGSGSNEASATPRSRPGPPSGLTAIARNGEISLGWAAPDDDGGSAVTGYKVYRGATSGGLSLHATLASVLTYLDAGLANGQAYYYMVTAVNGIGEGPDSGIISATPTNRPPTCLISDPLYLVSVSGTVTVAGTASDQDGTVTRVEVSIDGGSWITVDGTTEWSYSWDTKGVSDGRRTISARSFDGDGYSNLAKITVVVANQAPQEQDTAWIFALVLIIILGLILFYFFRIRRRKGEEKKPQGK